MENDETNQINNIEKAIFNNDIYIKYQKFRAFITSITEATQQILWLIYEGGKNEKHQT